MNISIQKGRVPVVLALCILVVSSSAQKTYLRPSLPNDVRSEALHLPPNSAASPNLRVEDLAADTALSPSVGATDTSVAQQTGLSPPKSVTTTGASTLSTTISGSVPGSPDNSTATATGITVTGAVPPSTTTVATAATGTVATPAATPVMAPGTTLAASPATAPLANSAGATASTPVTSVPEIGLIPTISPAPTSLDLDPAPTLSLVPSITMMPTTSTDYVSNATLAPTNDTTIAPTNTVAPSMTTGSLPPKVPVERQQPFLHRKVGIDDVTNSSLVTLVPAEDEKPAYFGNMILKSWFEFEWNVPVAGFFDVFAGVASPESGGSFHLVDMNTTLPYETFTGFNATMAWDTFSSFSRQIEVVTPGMVTMRVETVTEGFNLQYLYFTPSVLRDAIDERDNDMV